MSKAGKILLLLVVSFTIAGVTQKAQAFASLNVSSCASQLVSTPLCEEIETQSCNTSNAPREEIRQIQTAAVIAQAQPQPLQASGETNPIALLTMTPAPSEYAPNDAILDSDKIFDLINQYRTSVGLTPFERDDKVCELAQIRSSELAQEINNGTTHEGLYNRNLPYWIWENAKVGSDEEGTVAWWLSSPLHRESIVGDYKFSCVKCTGSVCSELFTNYSPKSDGLGE